MTDLIDPLVLDLVEWIAGKPRPYAEVIEAWHSTCPRLTVWEDAIDRGLLARRSVPGRGTIVIATPAGRDFLQRNGRAVQSA
jgi:hypothetical protein